MPRLPVGLSRPRTVGRKKRVSSPGERAKGERYGSFATREEIVQMLWRLSQQK